ncbi:unnamed protein product, partial [Phaeothamnion confervicola]
GIATSDLPKALVVHELLSISFLFATWGLFYHFEPTRSALFQPVGHAIEQSVWPPMVGARRVYQTALVTAETQFSKSKYLAARDPARLAASAAESSAFRKVLRPVTVPGKLLLAMRLTSL